MPDKVPLGVPPLIPEDKNESKKPQKQGLSPFEREKRKTRLKKFAVDCFYLIIVAVLIYGGYLIYQEYRGS